MLRVLLQFDGVAGGVVDPDLHVRLTLHPALVLDALRVELGDRGREVFDREAVVVAGRVDGGAARWRAHEMELEVADALPRAGHPGDLGTRNVREAEQPAV